MTARKATVPRACLETLSLTTQSVRPRPTAVTNATGSDSKRATTAAARAGRNSPPAETNGLAGMPLRGAAVMATAAARTPARIHTSWVRRRAGMPSMTARSPFSAMPRTAMPASVRNRNHVSPASATGTSDRARRSSPKNGVVPITCDASDSPVGNADDEGVGAEQVGHEDLHGGEHLQEPDRGDGDDEPRCVLEAPQQQIGQPAGDGAGDERNDDGHGPRPVEVQVGGGAELRGARSHGLVGEVHDPGGAVDEHEPDGQQPAGGSGEETLGDDAGAEGAGQDDGEQPEPAEAEPGGGRGAASSGHEPGGRDRWLTGGKARRVGTAARCRGRRRAGRWSARSALPSNHTMRTSCGALKSPSGKPQVPSGPRLPCSGMLW